MHKLVRIVKVEVLGLYELHIQYNDGFEHTVNIEDLLHGELYEPLRKLEEFESVSIDGEVGTLVWPCGADFDPDTLYNLSAIENNQDIAA